VFGNHGLCGLLEEGAHEKSPKCLGGNLGDFGEFCKGLSIYFSLRGNMDLLSTVERYSKLEIPKATNFLKSRFGYMAQLLRYFLVIISNFLYNIKINIKFSMGYP